MQKILTKYWVAINLAVLVAFSWLGLFSGVHSADCAVAWLALFAAEAFVLLPSLHREESFADARYRVVMHLFQDPFFYIGLALVLMLVSQALNGGCQLRYLPDADVWRYSAPSVEWLPSCVNVSDAVAGLLAFVAIWVLVSVIRNGMGRKSRFHFLRLVAMGSGCVGFWGVLAGVFKKEPYCIFSADPSIAVSCGLFFCFWLLVSCGVQVMCLARSEHRRATLSFFTAFLGNLAGALYFAPALPLVVVLILLLLLVSYGFLYLWRTNDRLSVAVRFLLGMIFFIAIGIGIFGWFCPGKPLASRAVELTTLDQSLPRLFESKAIRSRVALTIWEDAPWTGVGAGGFGKYVGMNLTKKEWKLVKKEPGHVLNDPIQFLSEYGVLGSGLLVAALIALIVPIAYRLRRLWIQAASTTDMSFFLQVPPYMVSSCMAVLYLILICFISSPFQVPGLLCSWFAVFAVASSALPVEHRHE